MHELSRAASQVTFAEEGLLLGLSLYEHQEFYEADDGTRQLNS